MEKFFQIALVSWILKIVGLVTGIAVLAYIIIRAKNDLKDKGPRGIIDEMIIGLFIIGFTSYFCFADGYIVVGQLIDRIVAIIMLLASLLLEAVENMF